MIVEIEKARIECVEVGQNNCYGKFVAVSYTHLDVYKRQPWKGWSIPPWRTRLPP